MARSDLLLTLVRAAMSSDAPLVKASVEALIAEERSKQHHVLADNLAAQLRNTSNRIANGARQTATQDGDAGLVYELNPSRTLGDLILPQAVRESCDELVQEHHRVDLLRSYALEPRSRMLLLGPPGNGKTSLAEAVADALMVPLLIVRYENVVGSYLGETSQRLLRLFEYARTRRCVLFFDEFDAVGKERGDVHESGEIKRVVSSLLMQMDRLPPHVVVITATNHPELLDRAVWRRFQLRLRLPRPGAEQREEWLARFVSSFGQDLGVATSSLVEKLEGASFAELEQFGLDIKRRWVLTLPNGNLRRITVSRLRQWQARAGVRKKQAQSRRPQ